MMDFQTKYSFDQRKSESFKILQKYPSRVPVIVSHDDKEFYCSLQEQEWKTCDGDIRRCAYQSDKEELYERGGLYGETIKRILWRCSRVSLLRVSLEVNI